MTDDNTGWRYGSSLWSGRTCPKWTDVEERSTEGFRLHVKATETTIDAAVMLALAEKCCVKVRDYYLGAMKWTKFETYKDLWDAPKSARFANFKIACLTAEEIQKLVEKKLIIKIDKNDARVVTNTFKLPEYAKERFRVLTWTRIVNEWYPKHMLQVLNLPTVEDVCDAVLVGEYQVQHDAECSFYQVLVPHRLQLMQTFKGVDGNWYAWTRMVMGQRSSVEVMEAHLRVLADVTTDENASPELKAAAAGVLTQVYVDNVRFSGTFDQCAAASKIFQARCKKANVSLNDPQDPVPSREEPFLGVNCNFCSSKVCAAAKIVAKLQRSWDRRDQWTVRQLAAHVGILNFCSRIIDFDKSSIFYALRYCAAKLTLHEKDPAWDQAASVPPSTMRIIERWTKTCLENEPRTPRSTKEPYQHLLVTDA
ncbi:MAG: hypothetical protein JKY54_19015, partial [Flavobacteriales bacterium]|nr:hypothetical protein [Flavobacteriales bacterium]